MISSPNGRELAAFLVTLVSILMYLGPVIALKKDPTSRADYRNGQKYWNGNDNTRAANA